MRFLGLSVASAVCLAAVTAASADELRLDDGQLDQVTAGLDLGFDPDDFSLGGSPLLREAAVITSLTIAQEYAAQNEGANVLADPVLGGPTIGLLAFGLTYQPQQFPFGLTPDP